MQHRRFHSDRPSSSLHTAAPGDDPVASSSSRQPAFRGGRSQEERLAARKVERDEKKERARTMAFFTAAKKALDDAASNHDEATLAGMVEGLVSELTKLLRSDKELHLLRNGMVCRTIEAAISASPSTLLQTKTVAYLLLGSVVKCMTSPTASYIVEAILWSLGAGVAYASKHAASAEESDRLLDLELTPGGSGAHPNSGVPNVTTLLEHILEEAEERIDELLVSDPGARCIRALAFALRGLPPPPKHQASTDSTSTTASPLPSPAASDVTANLPRFPALCARLAECVCESIERVFEPVGVERPRRADAWIAAAQTTATSFIIQGFLRCSDADATPAVYEAIPQGIRSMKFADKSTLLSRLMENSTGAHTYQCYLRVLPSQATLNSIDETLKLAVADADRSTGCGANAAAEQFVKAIAAKASASSHAASTAASGAAVSPVEWTSAFVTACRERSLFDESCPWMDAYSCFAAQAESWLSGESECLREASFFLQDLATFTPSSAHLALIFVEMIFPRLSLFLQLPALTAVLVRLTRKCAVQHRRQGVSGTLQVSELVERDRRNGARYHAVPAAMRGEIIKSLLSAIKSTFASGGGDTSATSSKCVPHTLLIDRSLGEHVGFELMCNALQFGPNPGTGLLLNSFDKLNVESLAAVAEHPQGSFVLQLWLVCASQYQPRSGAAAKNHSSTPAPTAAAAASTASSGGKKGADAKPSSTRVNASALKQAPLPPVVAAAAAASKQLPAARSGEDQPLVRRMVRRFMPLLERLCSSKYGCHVVESLYEHCPQDAREDLLQAVVPLYKKLHASTLDTTAATSGDAATAGNKRPRDEDEAAEAAEEKEAELAGNAGDFYARKTLRTLRVEQFLHRPDEWRGFVAKQHHVQSLMRRLMTLENADESAAAPAK